MNRFSSAMGRLSSPFPRSDCPYVAVVATHIAPALGYGGVSVIAASLTRAWANRDRKIVLCASDGSLGGRLRSEDVRLGENVDVRLYRSHWFKRWGFGLGAIPQLLGTLWGAEAVYIHGIATWPSTLAAVFCTVLRRSFMVAPRGGLMPEHVAWIRRKKPHKWLFYRWLTFPTLRRAIAVHCTSPLEATGVTDLLGDQVPVLVVPNGIDSGGIAICDAPSPEPGLTICFLGHVQPEKGINGFIRAWLKTRRDGDRLIVAGNSADHAYLAEFQKLVEDARGAVTYRGYVGRDEVEKVLAQSHFLVLPSGLEEAGGMRENFGNVVAEAMAAGRPVMVTRGLAWDHVQLYGTGFVFERSESSVCEVLRKAQSLSFAEWQQMVRSARQYVEQHLDAGNLGEQIWEALAVQAAGEACQPVGETCS